ncbi:MAG: hypothetical protein ACRDJH_03505, partial [Thermomicrobiales bacterium]
CHRVAARGQAVQPILPDRLEHLEARGLPIVDVTNQALVDEGGDAIEDVRGQEAGVRSQGRRSVLSLTPDS